MFGAQDFTFFYPSATSRFSVLDGKLVPLARDTWRQMRMEEQFDALLYLGPPSAITIAHLSPALCIDGAYMKMRLGRIEEEGPKAEADRLRQYCASVAPK